MGRYFFANCFGGGDGGESFASQLSTLSSFQKKCEKGWVSFLFWHQSENEIRSIRELINTQAYEKKESPILNFGISSTFQCQLNFQVSKLISHYYIYIYTILGFVVSYMYNIFFLLSQNSPSENGMYELMRLSIFHKLF